MPKKDTNAESEGVAGSAPDSIAPKRAPRRATKAALEPGAPPLDTPPVAANVAESASVDAPKRSRLAALGVLRRPKVALIGGAILVVGLNVWMALLVDGWKSEDADLRSANNALGQELADAQATNSFQKNQIALFTSQSAAASELASALEPVAAEHRDVSDALKAAGIDLRTCVNDRGTLIANLWSSSASAQAGLEAEVNAECDAATEKFNAIPEGN